MFNISNAIQALIQAEKVKASRHLTDEEKVALLCILRDIVTVIPGLQNGAETVRASICRMIESERQPETAVKSRKAKGIEKSPEVASGRTQESPEASTRATEGVEEPTEDAGRADSASGKPDNAKAKTKA